MNNGGLLQLESWKSNSRASKSILYSPGHRQLKLKVATDFYQTYLSRIENGKANPALNAMEIIANAPCLTVFELFDKVKERMPRIPAKTDSGPG